MEKLKGFQTVKNRSCSEEIISDATVYSKNEVETKYPYIDGLKAINKRIVWGSRKIREPVRMINMIGEIMNLHPSGDSSIDQAIKRLSQPFKVGIPLISISGKNGAYYDPEGAAAARYLSACISDFAYDVYFKGIDLRTIPMVYNKEFSGTEPKYLIPKIPMALLMGNLTVGYGWKSVVPMLSLDAVCDLVIAYASDTVSSGSGVAPASKYGKMLLPEFPTRCLITNKEEILDSYTHDVWNSPIRAEGVVELSGENITVRSVPYQVNFHRVTDDFRKFLKSKEGRVLTPYVKSARSLSAVEAEFDIPIVKGKNPFAILDMIRPYLHMKDPMYASYVYTNGEGKLMSLTPLKILSMWFTQRKQSVIGSLKYKQAELINDERRIRAMLLICDYADEVCEIIKSAATDEDAVRDIRNRFANVNLSWKQAEILVNQPIRILHQASKKKLTEDLADNLNKQKDNYAKFGKVNQIIIDDAKLIKEKYGKQSQKLTRYSSEFKGYVQFGDWGMINFFDEEDMINILSSRGWGSVKKSVHFYTKGEHRYIVKGTKLISMVNPSREITCTDVVCCPANDHGLTLVVNKNGNTAIIERDIPDGCAGWKLFPISKTFYAIHRDGSVTKELYTDYSIRKTVSCGAKTNIVYGLPNTCKDMIVFYMHTSEPNTLRVSWILHDGVLGKLATVPTGELIILSVCSIKHKEVCLNIPSECTKLVNIDFLIIKNIKELFTEGKSKLIIDLNKSSDISKKLKRHPQVRTLYMLN